VEASARVESVLAAEQALQAAVLASDVDALDALLHRDVRYTGHDGQMIDKAADLAAHRSGALDITGFDVEALDVELAGDCALTFVLAHLSGRAGGAEFSARLRYTRTWTREQASWQVIAAHASAVQS
jgi:ketosteroid isomerase-like protein